jgi:pentatricopeptide repeat protein
VGDYRQANQWLSIMSWEGVAASTVTYNCVLDACANGGNPQRAAELFQEMKDRKVRDAFVLLSVDVGGCVHVGGVVGVCARFVLSLSTFKYQASINHPLPC